jgi:phenylpropionate dioxygenase-like ring-hydroxylating dioxygenase large terminal subunit
MPPSIDDMLNTKHYGNALKPPVEAENLPPWCYTDESFHRTEIERVFMKVWSFVGRGDLLPNPGDYLATDVAGIPILLIHDEQGDIKAFANS